MGTETVVAEVAGENCLVVRVRELRGARTLSEVAARVGMRQDDLGRIERGETSSIRYETLLKLCTEFKVGPDEIFKVEPVTKSTPTPLERVLAAIEAGTVRTHKVPTSRGSHVLRQEESLDMTDSVNFADLEEPATTRRRIRPLSARVK
ncbi:MAG TPA: helix-turn-helix transcriptional regulator [Candidatus Paceibacterota bacterium]|nr:helix-turn-helix transcriptional regulator [Candidatus Paceibacterota bacterium]